MAEMTVEAHLDRLEAAIATGLRWAEVADEALAHFTLPVAEITAE